MRTVRAEELTGAECWELLASVPFGRIVFSQHAMPAIGVVRHLVDDRVIIARSPLGAAITGRGPGDGGTVVCYEADDMDPVRQTGWSVVVTGLARRVGDPAMLVRYGGLLPLQAVGPADDIVAIKPGLIIGRRLVD